MRNDSPGDQAVVSRDTAAMFFGMVRDRLKRRWNEHLILSKYISLSYLFSSH